MTQDFRPHVIPIHGCRPEVTVRSRRQGTEPANTHEWAAEWIPTQTSLQMALSTPDRGP